MTHSDTGWHGRIVVISGASSGIGLALQRHLDELGATTIGLNRTQPPHGLNWIQCDVGRRADVRAAAEQIAAQHDAIHGLVASAAIAPSGTVGEVSEYQWADTMRVNVAGTASCIAELLPQLTAGGGAVVTLGSLAATRGSILASAAYAASKGAVHSLTRHLASELSATGVRVNCVAPGPVDTPALQANRATAAPEAAASLDSVPMASADTIAPIIAFLLSRQSAHINGAVIDATGGAT